MKGVGKCSSRFYKSVNRFINCHKCAGVFQVVGAYNGEPTQFRDCIKSIEKYMLLAGGWQSKGLAYQTRGTVSDYNQRHMVEYPEDSWEELKSELNLRFASTTLHKAKASQTWVCTGLHREVVCFANYAFTNVDKAVVESQLVGFSLMGYTMTSYAWRSWDEIQNISGCSTVCTGYSNFTIEISLKVKWPWPQKTRPEEPSEIDHIRPQEKCFWYHKGGHLAKHCKSRSVSAIAQVKETKIGEVHCWRCGEVGHLKEVCQRTVDISISNTLETRLATKVSKTRSSETITLKPSRSQWGE